MLGHQDDLFLFDLSLTGQDYVTNSSCLFCSDAAQCCGCCCHVCCCGWEMATQHQDVQDEYRLRIWALNWPVNKQQPFEQLPTRGFFGSVIKMHRLPAENRKKIVQYQITLLEQLKQTFLLQVDVRHLCSGFSCWLRDHSSNGGW